MSNKLSWKFNHYILTCLVSLPVFLLLHGCSSIQKTINQLEQHQQLEEYRSNFSKGQFETVVTESLKVIEAGDKEPAAEVALYALGEVYAHHDFKNRDYAVSQSYFERLIQSFPGSPLASEAEVYISLFQAIAAREKVVKDQTLILQRAVINAKEKEIVRVEAPRKKIVKNQDFKGATNANIRMLSKAGGKKPADEAMYNLGLIYAHLDNPEKDYKKAQAFLYTLIEQFPDSQYAEEARIWLGLLNTIEQIQQIDMEMQQQRRKLTRQ